MMPRAQFRVICEALISGRRILVGIGDLTAIPVDAIVCPANSLGIMKGGVANTIREKGGDDIEREAMSCAPIAVGKAVVTSAGTLPARWVIHAPTMKNPVEATPKLVAYKATCAALRKADLHGFASISFPGMGTGTGGLAYDESASAMVNAIRQVVPAAASIQLVVLICRSTPLAQSWNEAIEDHADFSLTE